MSTLEQLPDDNARHDMARERDDAVEIDPRPTSAIKPSAIELSAIRPRAIELSAIEPRPGASELGGGEEMGRALSRREAMQWVLAAVAAASLPGQSRAAAPTADSAAAGPAVGVSPNKPNGPPVGGGKDQPYGLDPNLMRVNHPGDLWPLTFNADQRRLAAALADVILPADHYGPAASKVGSIEMMDEWISAPYDQQRRDKPVIIDGLAWLAAESSHRFGGDFAALSTAQQRAICDDICYYATTKPQFRKAAQLFSRFRSICASAYYATSAGWHAIGYIGNTPLSRFDGPPQSVLEKLGVTQTVKEPEDDPID